MKYNVKNKKGFTLIEVLIALAILSIALTAIIQSTSQIIRDHLYLQNKTIAMWVASDVMNQIQTGLIKPPLEPDYLQSTTTLLGTLWTWHAFLRPTPNEHIQEIHVEVLHGIKEVSYLYAIQ